WFGNLFVTAHENGTPAPARIQAVRAALDWFAPEEVKCQEHCVQVLIEDDEPDEVLYVFDDVFAGLHPHLTAYLMHDGPLPDGAGERGWSPTDPAFRKHSAWDRAGGEGRLYLSTDVRDDRSFYGDLSVGSVQRIDGLRLPGLCRWLMTQDPDELD